MEEPLLQIAENAGEEGAIVLGKVLESNDPNFGHNAHTRTLVKAVMVDPTKVVRTVLRNAGSIADLMLTTDRRDSGREKEPCSGRRW